MDDSSRLQIMFFLSFPPPLFLLCLSIFALPNLPNFVQLVKFKKHKTNTFFTKRVLLILHYNVLLTESMSEINYKKMNLI